MNKTEAAWADELQHRVKLGEAIEFWFETFTFKLAPDTRYTPDFVVMRSDGVMEAHEVKGFMRDDAHVKLKVAASKIPFRFYLVRWAKKEWDVQEVKSA